MTAESQQFLVPSTCPECGAGLCTEGMPPRRIHCGSEHEDGNSMCEWSAPVTVRPDTTNVIIIQEVR